jgi:hypothetical protein
VTDARIASSPTEFTRRVLTEHVAIAADKTAPDHRVTLSRPEGPADMLVLATLSRRHRLGRSLDHAGNGPSTDRSPCKLGHLRATSALTACDPA